MKTRIRFLVLSFGLLGLCSAADPASDSMAKSPSSTSPVSLATDPGYRLSAGDQIAISVYGEPDFTANQLIDRDGVVRLPEIEDTKLAGLSVRDAERAIQNIYVEKQILKKPRVNLVVIAFAPREVIVFGAVRAPGSLVFPRDLTSLDIIEIITRAGGFLPTAKSDAVTVTRKTTDGREKSETVDVDGMLSGRRRRDQKRVDYPIYPGDRIFVNERLF